MPDEVDRHFPDETTIHGIKDFMDAETRTRKSIWFVIISASMIGLVVQFGGTLMEYFSSSTASTVSPWAPRFIPDVLYCPHNWVSLDKMKYYGIDAELMNYIEGYLMIGMHFEYYIGPKNYILKPESQLAAGDGDVSDVKRREMEEMQTQHKTLKPKVDGILTNKAITLIHLILDLSFNVSDIFTDANFGTEKNVQLTRHFTNLGVCYRTHYDKQDLSLARLHYQTLNIKIRTHNASDSFMDYTVPMTTKVAVGKEAVSSIPVGLISLPMPKQYMLSLRSRKLQRTESEESPCSKDRNHDQAIRSRCLLENANRIACEGGCKLLNPKDDMDGRMLGEDQSGEQEFCNYFSNETHCLHDLFAMERIGKYRWEDCLLPCEEVNFDVTEHVESSPDPRYGFIKMGYENPFQGISIKQYDAYTVETLLSNIGGTISLWCGASVLSVIQIFYFIVLFLRRRRRGDQVQPVDSK